MGWILLHFITFSPSLLNENLSGESFVFTHFILVSVSFLLFYIVAFYIIPNMGTLQKKWFWVLIGSLVLAILFTYLKFRLEAYHTEYILNRNRGFEYLSAFTWFFQQCVRQLCFGKCSDECFYCSSCLCLQTFAHLVSTGKN